MTTEKALKIFQEIINAGVQRGIFKNAADVVLAQQALEEIIKSLSSQAE